VSDAERLFVLAPVGGVRLLVEADRVEEIAPTSRAEATGRPLYDVARTFDLRAPVEPRALLVGGTAPAWLVVDRGLRFERLDVGSMQPLPEWLGGIAHVRRVAALPGHDAAFGFELDLDGLIGRAG
jgi:hypothetical protein